MTYLVENNLFSSAVRTISPKEKGNRGFFPSKKVRDGIVAYESQIERDFFMLLEHADEVVMYQHQPIKIPYTSIDGSRKTYVPDVFVRFSNGLEILVEIKDEYTYQNEREKFEERWEACISWAEERKISFIVLTDIDIRISRLSNIWFTIGSSKETNNEKYMKVITAMISEDGVEYNSLCYQLAEELGVTINKASQICSYAIYHGYVFVDTFSEKPLTRTTVIRKSVRGENPFRPLWIELDEALDARDDDELFSIEKGSVKEVSDTDLSTSLNGNSKELLVVKEFLKTPSFKRTPEWRAKFEAKHGVSKTTIYRWVSKYESEGKSGLKKKYHKRGRNKSWNKYTIERLEKARKEFLKPNYSKKKAYEEIILDNWENEEDPPSYSSFWRYIKENTTYYEQEVSKNGRKRQRELQPSLKSFQGAIMPMQVLQFDNTPFDLFLLDEETKKSIGTPNLCAAIDVYTGMITGFELTLNSINRQSVLETLVQSITPKDRYVENLFSKTDYLPVWEIQGFPVIMLVDNGMDYRSEDVKRFCMEYDIILEFAPIRTPKYKAYIENWFNILKEAIAHELVDEGFRPNLRKRIENPDFDPEANVVFTYQQSELWLASWILDEYHFTNPYQDGLPAPMIRLENFERGGNEIILPLAREPPKSKSELTHLIINALITAERTLKDNIEFSNLKYSSPDLVRLYKKKGKIRVKLLYDHRDIRVIWLLNPDNGKPIELGLTYGWANAFVEIYGNAPISLSFWIKEVELMRSRNRQRISLSLFQKEKGKQFRHQLRSRAKSEKKTKRSRREKETLKENEEKLKRKSITPSQIRKFEQETKKEVKPKSRRSDVKTIRIPKEQKNPFAGKRRKKGGK